MSTFRIAITGPESTGKSILTEQLARHYQTLWVPEYAREYLKEIDRPYDYEDILNIAKGQMSKENALVSRSGKFLFCDTDPIVTKIWCDVKFGTCHSWILDQINTQAYDLYLLCDIDLPWQHDPLREHPDKRGYLFKLFHEELRSRKLPFRIISGMGDKRLKQAIKVIDLTF
ncbi:MAG: ATP-binding protein [Bacteroidota bacterium]|nr:ATP-binding protein [Bacteroidota bacterium]